MFKATLIDIGVGVARQISKGAVKWYFDPKKQKAAREKDRLRWARYARQAKTTPDDLDDRIAASIAARCKFRTMPGSQSLEDRVQNLLGLAMGAYGRGKHADAFAAIKAANDLIDEST